MAAKPEQGTKRKQKTPRGTQDSGVAATLWQNGGTVRIVVFVIPKEIYLSNEKQ